MVEMMSPSAAPAQGRRERNKVRVRSSIYLAALELFTHQGYDRTTVEEIADRADVARGTFFNHFQRKEDIIGEWSRQRGVLLQEGLASEGLDEPDGHDTRRTLLRCMSILARITTENAGLTRALLAAWVRVGAPLQEDPFSARLFTRFVEAGLASGEVPERVDPELAGQLLRDIYLGTLFRWVRTFDEGSDLEAELQAACTVLIDGLITD